MTTLVHMFCNSFSVSCLLLQERQRQFPILHNRFMMKIQCMHFRFMELKIYLIRQVFRICEELKHNYI